MTMKRSRNEDFFCQICSGAKRNYKCPRCNIGYCSSGCYKAHVCEQSAPLRGDGSSHLLNKVEADDKDSKLKLTIDSDDNKVDERKKRIKEDEDTKGGTDLVDDDNVDDDDDDDDDTKARTSVPVESLQKLRLDARLHSFLKDSRLQAIFRQIDKASDRSQALSAAKKKYGRDFTTVLDQMLLAIGAAKAEEEREVDEKLRGVLPPRKGNGVITFVGLNDDDTLKRKSLEVRKLAELKIAKITEVVLKEEDH
jgi:hypothetical protein